MKKHSCGRERREREAEERVNERKRKGREEKVREMGCGIGTLYKGTYK